LFFQPIVFVREGGALLDLFGEPRLDVGNKLAFLVHRGSVRRRRLFIDIGFQQVAFLLQFANLFLCFAQFARVDGGGLDRERFLQFGFEQGVLGVEASDLVIKLVNDIGRSAGIVRGICARFRHFVGLWHLLGERFEPFVEISEAEFNDRFVPARESAVEVFESALRFEISCDRAAPFTMFAQGVRFLDPVKYLHIALVCALRMKLHAGEKEQHGHQGRPHESHRSIITGSEVACNVYMARLGRDASPTYGIAAKSPEGEALVGAYASAVKPLFIQTIAAENEVGLRQWVGGQICAEELNATVA